MFRLAFLALLSSWLVSDHFPPWLSFHAEAPGFIATLIAGIGIFLNASKVIRIPISVCIIGALVLIPVFQHFFGGASYFGDVLVSATYLLAFAIAWSWGYQWAKESRNNAWLDVVALGLAFVGLVVLFQLLAQWFRVDDAWAGWVLHHLPNSRPRANIGQPNQAATTLVIAIVAFNILYARNKISSLIFFIAIEILTLGLILTQSRTAILSAVVLILVYAFIVSKRLSKMPPRLFSLNLLWFCSFLIGTHLFSIIHWDGGAGEPVVVERLANVGTRPLIWGQIWAAITAKPLWGWGVLRTAEAQQFGALQVPGTEQVTYAHNILLDCMVWIGVLWSFVIVIIIACWVWKLFGRMHGVSHMLAPLLMLIPLVVHTFLEFPHAYSYFLVLSGLILGAVDSSLAREGEGVNVSKSIVFFSVLFWFGLLTAVAYEYWKAEEDFRINRFENLNIGETPAEYVPPKIVLLTQLRDLLQAMRLRAKRGMAAEELDTLERASLRYTWANLQLRAAIAFGLNGRLDKAEDRMRVLKNLFPSDAYIQASISWKQLSRQYPELLAVKLP